MNVELLSTDGEEAQLRVDGRVHAVPYAIQGTTVSFHFDGEIYFVEVEDKSGRGRAGERAAAHARAAESAEADFVQSQRRIQRLVGITKRANQQTAAPNDPSGG